MDFIYTVAKDPAWAEHNKNVENTNFAEKCSKKVILMNTVCRFISYFRHTHANHFQFRGMYDNEYCLVNSTVL